MLDPAGAVAAEGEYTIYRSALLLEDTRMQRKPECTLIRHLNSPYSHGPNIYLVYTNIVLATEIK